ncbi:MAG TPA: serine hydrolase domain-containing protein [Gemmatimonadales bacterium]
MIAFFLLALLQTPDSVALDAMRDSLAIRGVAVAVIRADGSRWVGTFGTSHPGAPITGETAFDVGSVGKMYTAAVILSLVHEGLLDLDAPIARWLPEAPHADAVTSRMLLTHTSGWADVWDDRSLVPQLVMAPTRRWTAADILTATPAPTGAPGAAWDYSSTGYVALGAIAETVSGRSFDELLRTRVLEPHALGQTVHGAYADPTLPVAHAWLDINNDGTAEDFTALIPATSWRTAAGTAGAILTTASDLATFTRAFVTGHVLGGSTSSARDSSVRPFDSSSYWIQRPDGNHHGLGVLRTALDGVELIGHRGNAAGYSAAAWHAPTLNVTIVVVTNGHGQVLIPLVQVALASFGAER